MAMTNLLETEKGQNEGKDTKVTKQRRRKVFFNTVANNSIPQLPPGTTFKLFQVIFHQNIEKKLKNPFQSLIQNRKNKKKRTVGKLNKTNTHGRSKLKCNRKTFLFFFQIN